MPENDNVEIFVTVLDERLQLILPGDGWDFEEAKVAKNVSEGMSPAQIEGSLLEGDPDAWLAVLRVSYMRAGKDYPAQRIMGQNVIELMSELAEATKAAMKKRPPTRANGSESTDSGESSETALVEVPS